MTMAVGYLHLGTEDHGIRRYSQVLSQEALRTNDVSVAQLGRIIAPGQALQHKEISDMVAPLGDCGVVHAQFNRAIWGDDTALHNIGLFAERLPCPFVTTIHDIYVPSRIVHFRRMVKPWLKERMRLGTPATTQAGSMAARGADYRRLASLAALLIVCSREEKRRLQSVVPASMIRIVPHFVESSPMLPDPTVAKRELGLLNRKVVTLLGFIHRRKGHALLLEALARLPQEYVVVFLGGPCPGPGCEEFLNTLRERAKALRTQDRLRITGYVGQSELATYLAATDLAACPFSRMSASGSLSTWIACRKPILASRIPQIADYNDMAPGAIDVFWPLTAEALAERIQQVAEKTTSRSHDALNLLAKRLSVSTVYRQHLELYHLVVDSRAAQGGSVEELSNVQRSR